MDKLLEKEKARNTILARLMDNNEHIMTTIVCPTTHEGDIESEPKTYFFRNLNSLASVDNCWELLESFIQ